MSAHDPSATGGRGFDLIEFATRRRVTIAMMTLTLVLFGLISLSSLKVELLPDLSIQIFEQLLSRHHPLKRNLACSARRESRP